MDLSTRFYSTIPHVIKKSQQHPVLCTLEQLKQKSSLLQSLEQIVVAATVLKNHRASQSLTQSHYLSLSCNITALAQDDQESVLMQKFFESTKGDKSFNNLRVQQVFSIDRQGEAERFDVRWKGSKNRMFLWHGSRLANFVGLLSQGLRIAPPEAPASGYLFGKVRAAP